MGYKPHYTDYCGNRHESSEKGGQVCHVRTHSHNELAIEEKDEEKREDGKLITGSSWIIKVGEERKWR